MAFRFVVQEGRAAILLGDEGVADVARVSAGALPPDPLACLAQWDTVRDFAEGLSPGAAEAPLVEANLGAPVPFPRQVFGVGLNYRDHAAEAGLEEPRSPLIFTKFPTCIGPPHGDIALTSDRVDWEVELVVVVGRGGRRIPEATAASHVAGFCVGQDVSDRRLQFAGKPPQFSLGKSAPGFGPIGPALVTLDAFADPDDLSLTCDVSGERMQDGRTRDMIFSVAELVAFLSRQLPLLPGDLIFTGTPAGVGSVREPRRYLAAGDRLESAVEGIGTLRNRCVEPPGPGGAGR
jgi:2-keto-4-pentenoate hydratase/2-oxohepta-3-ene-1,7-dioic acid hydratase in catechol pathway